MQILSAEAIMLLFLIAITICIIFVRNILAIMIIYCAFSFAAMILYMFSGAPDVAFTEAVIGVISTLYFVVALRSTQRHAKRFTNKRKASFVLGVILTITILVIFSLIVDRLPSIGDPTSAPNMHIAKYYIENGEPLTEAPNLVTEILADFRGFDTMLETTVMFLAGMAVCLILSNRREYRWDPAIYEKDRRFDGIDLRVIMAVAIPLILVFAVYVLMHGEVSLGGGFQAGALLAIAYILFCTFDNPGRFRFRVALRLTISLAACGVIIYALAGLIPMLNGGKFMEYGKLPFPAESAAALHAAGITMIEVGVTIGVAATIVTIFNAILIRNQITKADTKKKQKNSQQSSQKGK